MARMLPTTYKDDVLDISVNERRRFNMIQNTDGTVSFEDVTAYVTEGTLYGALDVNRTNSVVNSLSHLTGGFLVENVAVNLGNKTFTYSDERITDKSLALVFWNDADKDIVSSSNVYANTINGGLKFDSSVAPTRIVTCSIYIVAIDESEE